MSEKTITREMLLQIGIAEDDLGLFHAYRHLWAELVANHRECGLSRETLEIQQVEALSRALGSFYTVARMLGIKWIECESRDARTRRRLENEAVAKALTEYHHALDMREHAGGAAHRFVEAVQTTLGRHWVQGNTLTPAVRD